MKICVICRQPIPVKVSPNGHEWAGGNNADPVAPGRCCDTCNERFVVPARLAQFYLAEKEKNTIPEQDDEKGTGRPSKTIK